MKIQLKRTYNNDRYCIGHLYIDGVFVMDTLEDTDRGLDQKMSLKQIAAIKKKSVTAIPTGLYRIDMKTVSPKYSKKKFFMDLCKARMPRLVNVPGYSGVLMHPGNKPEDTDGCLLVGQNKVKGQVINSTLCFVKLYDILEQATLNKEEIWIEITRAYKV